MKPVTKEEFYKIIFDKHLNVHPKPVGDTWPYVSIFKFPNGEEFGREVPIEDGNRARHFWETQYYVNTECNIDKRHF